MTGPAALVRSLPAALGRQPADAVLLVGIADTNLTAASIAVIDVADVLLPDDGPELRATTELAATATAATGSSAVVVVAYADDARFSDSTAARVAATAVVCAEAVGLRVLDAIAVADGRWRSYECTDPACCPPGGRPITTEENPTP